LVRLKLNFKVIIRLAEGRLNRRARELPVRVVSLVPAFERLIQDPNIVTVGILASLVDLVFNSEFYSNLFKGLGFAVMTKLKLSLLTGALPDLLHCRLEPAVVLITAVYYITFLKGLPPVPSVGVHAFRSDL